VELFYHVGKSREERLHGMELRWRPNVEQTGFVANSSKTPCYDTWEGLLFLFLQKSIGVYTIQQVNDHCAGKGMLERIE
jgi:hypothetical protein